MSQLVTISPQPRSVSLIDRARYALRSFWTGPLLSSDPALARVFGDGYQSASGITVTERNAFTFSAVYDAVNQIASDVGKLPLNLKKKRQDGGTEDFDTPLHWLLKNSPNPEMDSMVFRRTVTAHALTCKGGYAEIERNGAGQPIALWILTPDRVEVFREQLRSGTLGPVVYRIDGSDDHILDGKDILQIHGLGYDGTQAYPLIHLARQAIGLALAAEQFSGTVFRQGRFGGVLATEDDRDEPQQKATRDAINGYKKGYEQFLLLFGAKWTYTRTAIASSEAELNQTRDRQIQEVARFFNMPLHKLKHPVPGAVSYSSVEMADLDYYKGCLLNWITLWEQQLNRKLIPPLERKQQFFKHNVNAFLRGDIKSRYDALGVARDKGIINADEWRELEDMNPQEGGQGQLYLVQSAQVPLKQLEALTASQIKKNETPPQPPAPPSNDDDRHLAAELEAATARAEKAEAAAEELRQEVSFSKAAIAAAEASGTATAEELAQRRAELLALAQRSDQMDVLAEFVKERAITLQQMLDEQTAERVRLEFQVGSLITSQQAAEVAAATVAAVERDAAQRQQTIEADLRAQLDADLAAARQQAEDAEAARVDDDDRAAAVLSSHRALMVDVMRRTLEREVEKARVAQTTPEKMRTFLAKFYDGHAELFSDRLLPVVRVHLAYTRSTDDPVALTRRLVTQHIEESQRQIRAVLDGGADDFAVSLSALLRRWERERIDTIPDLLMQRGLDYARNRER